tara:strand:- start:786 stop:1475 length:690 start_codon:yes stop_codon:yes gene_type:complete
MLKEHLFVLGMSAGGIKNHLPGFLKALESSPSAENGNLTGIIRAHNTEPYFTELITESWARSHPQLQFKHLFPEEADIEDDVSNTSVWIQEGKINICPAGWYSHIETDAQKLKLMIEGRITGSNFPLDDFITSTLNLSILEQYQVHIAVLSGMGKSGSRAIVDAMRIGKHHGGNPRVYILEPEGLKIPYMPHACIAAAQEQGYRRQIDYHRMTAAEIGGYIARQSTKPV